MNKDITLIESLCGVDFEVEHLDGTKFRVQSPDGRVIKPNEIMQINEKGMPFHKTAWKFGHLFIKFNIIFPETLSAEQKDKVHHSLIGVDKQKTAIPNERIKEVKTMNPFDPETRNSHHQGGNKAQDSDDEREDKERVQCNQQ